MALSEVVLIGSPIRTTQQKTAASVSLLTAKELAQTDGVIVTPLFNKVPGIYMQQGTLNTNRITIRGIGARSQYSTNRIKAYFEEIPLTTAEGETTIEDIDLSVIQKIEISKGPNSTSFGSGLGGVIHLFGNQNFEEKSVGKGTTTVGSFGLQKNTISAALTGSKSNFFANYSHLQSDGFRENSAYDRQSVSVFGKHQVSHGELNYIGMTIRLQAFIPSSINQTDFDSAPKKAATNWAIAEGYESYDKLTLGLGYTHNFSANWTWKTSVFGHFKTAYEPRPFNILRDQTNSFGLRSSVNHERYLFYIPTKMSIGTEWMKERYLFTLYENLYLTQPGQGSVIGNSTSQGIQNRYYGNFFWQLEMQLTTQLHLESGITLNQTHYAQKNQPETVDISQESYSFPVLLSPRIGLSYQLVKGKNLYAALSKGFSHPNVAETLSLEGTLNPDLLPEIGLNYEMGFKGNFWNGTLYMECSVYITKIKNLLVAQRIAEDQYVGSNAGASRHQGIEFLLNGRLISTKKLTSSFYLSGSFTDFKFVDFIDRDNSFSGNKLPSVPNYQWNLGIDSQFKSVCFSAVFRKVGSFFLNDGNTLASKSYGLLDLHTHYTLTLTKKLTSTFQLGIQNSLDKKYAASIVPNAVGFGTNPPRYYYPGNPRNYYGSLNLNYRIN